MRFKWNEEKINILIENYGKITEEEISKLVECKDIRSISKKLMELGLWKYKYLNENDEKNIVNNYGKKSSKELANIFNKSIHDITRIWRKYGIRKDVFEWTDEKIKILKKMYPKENKEKILVSLGANSWINVSLKASKLGLKRNTYYSKNDLIKILKELYNDIGRTPTVYDLKGISVGPFIGKFGSYSNACEEAGLVPNKSDRAGNISGILYSKNNDKCYSISELIITEFFIKLKFKYKKEGYYKEISSDNKFGNMKFDWILYDEIIVEFFGINDDEYRKKSKLKLSLCKKNGLKIIPLYPKDLKEKVLKEKFNFLSSNP